MGIHFRVRSRGRSLVASAVRADPIASPFTPGERARLRALSDRAFFGLDRFVVVDGDGFVLVTTMQRRAAMTAGARRLKTQLDAAAAAAVAKSEAARARAAKAARARKAAAAKARDAWAKGCPVCLNDEARELASSSRFLLHRGRPGLRIDTLDRLRDNFGITASEALRHVREHEGRKPGRSD